MTLGVLLALTVASTGAVVEHPTVPQPAVVVSFDAEAEPDPLCSRINAVFSVAELVSCFGEGWAGLAMCESSGRSGIVALDVNNRTSHGLVQFQQRTWDYVVADLAGRPDLAGRDPATLPADVQVAMGEALKEAEGLRPWGCAWAWGRTGR